MKITNINQLLPFVEKKAEFIVIDKGDYQVIDYVYQDDHTFDDPELMECRGIKFSPEGLILARPFRKFFNYGERGSDLPAHRPHVITHKLDGSMVHPILIRGQLFLHTRKGHTDVAKKAERFLMSATTRRYSAFCTDALLDGWTPIFEYTGPNNRIVLRYDTENMSLLAIRHTIEGVIRPYPDMVDFAKIYNVPVVQTKNFQLKGQIDEFVKHTRELEDAEGYVIYFDDGYMVKIKAEDYVLKHRALDDLSSKKKVVALCAQGFMDDVLPILSVEDGDELIEFNRELQAEVNTLTMVASSFANMVVGGDMTRKVWALEWAKRVQPSWLSGVVFGVMDGKDARMLVLKAIQKNYETLGIKWRGE